jgi:uncharacterized protein YfiM (DUF2279 family)
LVIEERDMKEIIIALLICVSSMGQTVPHDKVMHFSSCYIISATSTTILSYKYEKNKAAWIGFGIGATIGISKEIYDMKWGHSDENDLYADILGAALGSITIRISLNKRKKNR